ncbi:hypothetical protein HPP05_00985 [Corallococcus exiguus]|uniref:hypothetical protein n=1 Tax=Corallococcus exiguus TaxID=83462 RepID=UPI00149416BE|nr:hypothetical protein [Corallococcus exiguus]NPC68323.1 hypothetical protein [Corallococcus exiguus]
MAPRVPLSRPDKIPPDPLEGCRTYKPTEVSGLDPQVTAFVVCAWYREDLGRRLSVSWEADSFPTHASLEENVERLRKTLVQSYGIPEDTLSRLPSPWNGWEMRRVSRGKEMPGFILVGPSELLRVRWIVLGTGRVTLHAPGLEQDPFPEGEAFLDSLRVTTVEPDVQ